MKVHHILPNKVRRVGAKLYRTFRPYRPLKKVIPETQDPVQFFCELERFKIQYVLLRGYDLESLNRKQRDFDVLLSDDSVSIIQNEKLYEWSNSTNRKTLDLYSTSGLPGFAWKSMAYFPPDIAVRILSNSILTEHQIRVPNAHDHFLSLLYHIVYHKGHRSGFENGLDREISDKYVRAKQKYLRDLLRTADLAQITFDSKSTLSEIDTLLLHRGWRPPLDTLIRLSPFNPWLRRHISQEVIGEQIPKLPLLVILVRESSDSLEIIETIERRLENLEFEVRLNRELYCDEKQNFSKNTRGGNWRGDYPTRIIFLVGKPRLRNRISSEDICHDEYPEIRILKNTIRSELFYEHNLNDKKSLVFHSSDNSFQALHYLSFLREDERRNISSSLW